MNGHVIDKMDNYRGWTTIEEHTMSGKHAFSGLKLDGIELLDILLEVPSLEELHRQIDEREGHGLR